MKQNRLRHRLLPLALTLTFIVFVLTGCTHNVEGFLPTPADVSSLQIGETTRDDVLTRFGTPSLISPPQSRDLFYLKRESVVIGPNTYETKRNLIAIRFSDQGILSAISYLDDDDKVRLSFSRDTTQVAGIAEPGIIADIVSNIGRFSPE